MLGRGISRAARCWQAESSSAWSLSSSVMGRRNAIIGPGPTPTPTELEIAKMNFPNRMRKRLELASSLSEADFLHQKAQKDEMWHHLQPEADAPEITINWMDTEGHLHKSKHKVGQNLLKAAQQVDMDLPALCDGAGGDERDYQLGPMCSTCHVYIASAYLPQIEEKFPFTDNESSIMYWIKNTTANSRLACMIELTPEMDGMTVAIPEFPEWDHGDPVLTMEEDIRLMAPEYEEIAAEIVYQDMQEEQEDWEKEYEDTVITGDEVRVMGQMSTEREPKKIKAWEK
eukprot:gb/GEZN01004451.1/.p1 GENE.gb/GEZN01004451.1/~~gb/GEZN01004451.1/.p1  ORF type:complete len:286 (+),score=49.05 gb/GEZN01004451.1/:844-1701(+)